MERLRGVYEEQQSGRLIIKCDMFAISLSKGPIQLRRYEASGPHKQMQQTHIPRKLFAKKVEGNSSLAELAQRGKKILFSGNLSCRRNKHYSLVARGYVFTGPEMHRNGAEFYAFILLILGILVHLSYRKVILKN